METLPWRLFPWLMVLYTGLLIVTKRDWGPLYHLEASFLARRRRDREKEQQRALHDVDVEMSPIDAAVNGGGGGAGGSGGSGGDAAGRLDPPPGIPARWYNAAVPFLLVIVATFLGMFFGGMAALQAKGEPVTFQAAMGAGDSVTALIWATSVTTFVLFVMVRLQRLLTVGEMVESWGVGIQELIEPTLILVLAWALGDVIHDVHTARYIADAVGSNIPLWLVNPLSLLLSMVISFATGSAMGTMGILFPLLLPLAFELGHGDETALVSCAACIFSGCSFGNSCSPIGDTTILTGIALQCDIDSHVRTMLPHCLLVAAVSLAVSFLPTPVWVWWVVGCALLGAFVALVGRNPEHQDAPSMLFRCCPKLAAMRCTMCRRRCSSPLSSSSSSSSSCPPGKGHDDHTEGEGGEGRRPLLDSSPSS